MFLSEHSSGIRGCRAWAESLAEASGWPDMGFLLGSHKVSCSGAFHRPFRCVSCSSHHLSMKPQKKLVPSGSSCFCWVLCASPVFYFHCKCDNSCLVLFVISCYAPAQNPPKAPVSLTQSHSPPVFTGPSAWCPRYPHPNPWLPGLKPHWLPCWASSVPGPHLP